MTTRRRLRQAEQEAVKAAARESLEGGRSAIVELERELVTLQQSLPAELQVHAVRGFMNELGRELSSGAEIARILDQAGE